MSNQIHARELSTSDINGILMNLQSLSTDELRGTIRIMASDLKNNMKIIRNNYDTIDKVTKKWYDAMSKRQDLFDRCHELAAEVNSLRNKLARVEMCEFCKKCCA